MFKAWSFPNDEGITKNNNMGNEKETVYLRDLYNSKIWHCHQEFQVIIAGLMDF